MKAEEPGQAIGNAVTNSDTDMKQLYKCIYVDVSFVKSITGIITAAEIILSLLGLIIVAASYIKECDFLYGKTYSYFDFVSGSCFFTSGIWYLLNALGVLKKFGVIRWDIGAFGFLCLVVIAGHGGWQLKRFFDKRRQSLSSQSRGQDYEEPPAPNAAVEDDSKY
ncbi:hypothetical protein CHS0354_009391 [Potamilus streckersoni]|uniref:MARVEL domain-containing protein n=1 Tax=Potamilus streckersoni TaxID=2493646 RepID=A0AAE0T420_9BIVA|nr:hypothetical protein CHS0354_009391 [Potamilus streckersoni]